MKLSIFNSTLSLFFIGLAFAAIAWFFGFAIFGWVSIGFFAAAVMKLRTSFAPHGNNATEHEVYRNRSL